MPDTQNQNPLPPDNEAVLKHIDMFQGIISRMASNSSACKNWCIVLVSAYLAYAANNGKLNYIELSAIPVMIFWFLDAYYLGLERKFIAQFNQGVKKLRNNSFTLDDLYKVEGDKKLPKGMLSIAFSWSVLPVYSGLISIIIALSIVSHI